VNRGVVDVSMHEDNIVEIESSGHLFHVESKHLSSLQDNTLCQKTTRQYLGNALISKAGKHSRFNRQFIYPVLRPIENKMQSIEAKVDSPMLSANPPKRR
jgi:hypothetical protein